MLCRPLTSSRSDSKGTCAEHLEASAPSSPEYAGRSGDGGFAKPVRSDQGCLGFFSISAGSTSRTQEYRTGDCEGSVYLRDNCAL